MKKHMLTVVFSVCLLGLTAQVKRSAVGIGTIGGMNSAYAGGGVSLIAVFYNHFDVNAGLATRHYQGAGISFGWRYYPLGIKYFSPVIGVNYISMNNRRFSVLKGNYFSIYSTPENQYIVPAAGVTYTYGQVDFLCMADYAFARNKVHTTSESGLGDAALMETIDGRINGGPGFTFGVMFRPWSQRKPPVNEFPSL